MKRREKKNDGSAKLKEKKKYIVHELAIHCSTFRHFICANSFAAVFFFFSFSLSTFLSCRLCFTIINTKYISRVHRMRLENAEKIFFDVNVIRSFFLIVLFIIMVGKFLFFFLTMGKSAILFHTRQKKNEEEEEEHT